MSVQVYVCVFMFLAFVFGFIQGTSNQMFLVFDIDDILSFYLCVRYGTATLPVEFA